VFKTASVSIKASTRVPRSHEGCTNYCKAFLMFRRIGRASLGKVSSSGLSFASVIFTAFVSSFCCAGETPNPYLDWETLTREVSQAAEISSSGLYEFLTLNCRAIRESNPDADSEACRVINLATLKAELHIEIENATTRRRVFAIGPLSEYSIRTGFYVLNPRLNNDEKIEIVTALVKSLVVDELLSHAIERARSKILLWSSEHNQVTNAVLGSVTTEIEPSVGYFKFWKVRNYWPNIKRDLDIIVKRHGDHFMQLAKNLENYDSIPWAEYEAFLPIVEFDQIYQRVYRDSYDELYKAVVGGNFPLVLNEYVESMTPIVSVPPGLSDEHLRHLYSGILIVSDFNSLSESDPSTLEEQGYLEFTYESSRIIENQILSHLNVVTKELRNKENALGL